MTRHHHSHIYPLYGTKLGLLHKFLNDMLGKGFIQSSQSPVGAPVLFAKKKDSTLRLCVDFRNLNKLTRKDRYLILLVTNLLDQLGSAKVYTKLDLCTGYYNVHVATGHEWKTAFHTRYGSFEFLVIPMGLTNAPAMFKAFMNHIFRDMTDIFVVIYLDDILIFSNSLEDHQVPSDEFWNNCASMTCTPNPKSVCSTLRRSNSWDLWSPPLASPWTLPRPMLSVPGQPQLTSRQSRCS